MIVSPNSSYDDIVDKNFNTSELGRGYWGVVYSAKLKNYDTPVAVKKTEINDDTTVEINVCSQIHALGEHPNIIKYWGYAKDKMFFYLFFELAQMTLSAYLDKNKHDKREPKACKGYAADVVNALTFLHQNKIYHRDLRPDNVLLVQSSSSSSTIKLADFGISLILEHHHDPNILFCDMHGLSHILYLLLTDDEIDTNQNSRLILKNRSIEAYTDFIDLQEVIKQGWVEDLKSRPCLAMYKAAVESPKASFANKRKFD